MPCRIGNTLVPRNPVAPAATQRRAGAHQAGRSAVRQRNRAQLQRSMEDWREELAFERALASSDDPEEK